MRSSTPRLSREQMIYEDLKAFESRMTEVVTCLRPAMHRWRIILAVVTICSAIGAWQWLTDPTVHDSFLDSLWNHKLFTVSILVLVLLFLTGIHDRVVASTIITSRARIVLQHYSMSCDARGKLILKPRPRNS